MLIQGLLHPLLKIGMFCVLSQNYQHFLKKNISILKQIVQGNQNGIEILLGQAFF